MKTNIKHLLTAICILAGIGFTISGCDDYNYKTDDSFYNDVTIKVQNTVDNVLSINLYNEDQITFEVNPKDLVFDMRAFTYTVSDLTVLTIDDSGNIKPLKEGTVDVNIVFRANKKVSTSCKIRIWRDPVPVQDIKMPDHIKTLDLKVDQSFDLASNIVILPGNADNKELEYISENTAIAKIDDKGVVTGVAKGKAKIIIKATDGSGVTAECTINVVPEVKVSEIQIPAGLDGKTVAINQKIYLGSKVAVLPETADNREISYRVVEGNAVTIDDKGMIKTVAEGTAKIRISTTDGSGIFKELTLTVNNSAWIDRSFWTINTSIVYANGQNYVTDGATGKAEHILDGDTGTFLSLVKPGKSYAAGGSTYVTPADHQLYFIIDMGVAQKFNYIQWAHRAGNSNNYLRVWGIGVYGSNDGTSFTAIKTGIDIPYGSITPPQELPIPSSEYRYVKVTIEKWSDNSGGSKSGSTVQISEFNLGNK